MSDEKRDPRELLFRIMAHAHPSGFGLPAAAMFAGLAPSPAALEAMRKVGAEAMAARRMMAATMQAIAAQPGHSEARISLGTLLLG